MKKWIKSSFLNYIKKRFDLAEVKPYQKKSFAQSGEDLIVEHIFNVMGISNPSYIDIGAHHPLHLSNTQIFYEKGGKGLNIEPTPYLYNNFLLYRPKDINLNIGIGEKNDTLEFYEISDPVLNTFSKGEAKEYEEQGFNIISKSDVDVFTIEHVLENYCDNKMPNFLSIDIEGLDERILRSINFQKHPPLVICAETITFSMSGKGIKKQPLIDYIISQGYIVYADTNINTIFVKKDSWIVKD